MVIYLLKKSAVDGLKVAAAMEANWFKLTPAEWCLNWNGLEDMEVETGEKLALLSGWKGVKLLEKLAAELMSFGLVDKIFSMVKMDGVGEEVDFGIPM